MIAIDMLSGHPVFLSLSFILWRREWMTSLVSVMTFRKRFMSIAEAASRPRSLA